jgi:plasmid stabilization system protein ParE
MSAPRRLPVVATRRFERALDALLDYYDSIRHLHPDAGTRALRLIDLVAGELPRLLAAQPDIGRPAQLSLIQSESEKSWLNRLAPLTARRRLQAREWLLGDFWILYYRSASAVYLASARHEREAEYW